MGSYSKGFDYSGKYKTIFQGAKKALAKCGFRVLEADEGEGIINASTSSNMKSWGENINVVITKTKKGAEVYATSTLKFGLFDWGKNKKNIDEFFETLK